MEKKTYFRQLLDLAPQVECKGSIIKTLYEDAVRRVVDTKFSNCEVDACYENTSYAKRNLEFVKEILSIE